MAKKNTNNDEVEFDLVDATGSSTMTAESFIEENQSKILMFLAALVIIVGGYMAYKYLVKAPMEKEASAQLFKAEAQFARDSFALALENPGGGYEGLLDIIDNYGGTRAANSAKYYAGISYLNMGRFDDAIEYLNSFSGVGDITPIMKQGALGDAYSENGDMDKAISHYKKAAAYTNELLSPYYMNKLALLYQTQDDNAAAKNTYQSILDKYPLSTEAKEAEKFVLRLN